jgi:hypothetical protein
LQLSLREGGDAGRPVVVAEPGSPAGQALLGAARELARVSRSIVGKPLLLGVAPRPANGTAAAAPQHAHAGHDHASHAHQH